MPTGTWGTGGRRRRRWSSWRRPSASSTSTGTTQCRKWASMWVLGDGVNLYMCQSYLIVVFSLSVHIFSRFLSHSYRKQTPISNALNENFNWTFVICVGKSFEPWNWGSKCFKYGNFATLIYALESIASSKDLSLMSVLVKERLFLQRLPLILYL